MSLYISIYAAIIATLVLLWRIYEFYVARAWKFRIMIDQTYKGAGIFLDAIPESAKILPQDIPGYEQTFQPVVIAELLNLSQANRAINLPDFTVTNFFTNETRQIHCPDMLRARYPKTLEPGENLKFEIMCKDLFEIPFSHLDKRDSRIIKIKFHVTDNYGKRYKSKSLKVVESKVIRELSKLKASDLKASKIGNQPTTAF